MTIEQYKKYQAECVGNHDEFWRLHEIDPEHISEYDVRNRLKDVLAYNSMFNEEKSLHLPISDLLLLISCINKSVQYDRDIEEARNEGYKAGLIKGQKMTLEAINSDDRK